MSGWKSCRFIFPLDDLGTRTIKESLPNFSVKKSTNKLRVPILDGLQYDSTSFYLPFCLILVKNRAKIQKNAHLAKIFYEKFA